MSPIVGNARCQRISETGVPLMEKGLFPMSVEEEKETKGKKTSGHFGGTRHSDRLVMDPFGHGHGPENGSGNSRVWALLDRI